MGKKQQEQRQVKTGNQKSGGIGGRQNILAVKNEFTAADSLRKGRHECLCQARIHALVLNCLGCGRIVCEQEGSGPCFTCGTLVCTREEREILNRGSKKSAELLAKLQGGGVMIGLKDGTKSYQDATAFRNRLLEADADTERRTKVNDLQSDYSTIENSPFLSAQERADLKQRREELRLLRDKERKQFVVNINFDGGIVHEAAKTSTATSTEQYDPVILRIMEKADERQRLQEALHTSTADARWNPIGFIPRYLCEEGQKVEDCSNGAVIDRESLMIVSDEIAAQITEEKGWTIALTQPSATFLQHGLIRFIRWSEDVMIKGPLFIVAKTGSTNNQDISTFAKKYVRDKSKMNGLDFADGSVLGRAFLDECMLLEDFYEKFGSKSAIPGDGNYVLCFNSFEPLVSSIPHISNAESDLYELDRQLKKSLTKH